MIMKTIIYSKWGHCPSKSTRWRKLKNSTRRNLHNIGERDGHVFSSCFSESVVGEYRDGIPSLTFFGPGKPVILPCSSNLAAPLAGCGHHSILPTAHSSLCTPCLGKPIPGLPHGLAGILGDPGYTVKLRLRHSWGLAGFCFPNGSP